MSITSKPFSTPKTKGDESLALQVVAFIVIRLKDRTLPVSREDLDAEFSASTDAQKMHLSQVLINLLEYGWIARRCPPGEAPYFWSTDQATTQKHPWSHLGSRPRINQRTVFTDLYASAKGIKSPGLVRYRETELPQDSEFPFLPKPERQQVTQRPQDSRLHKGVIIPAPLVTPRTQAPAQADPVASWIPRTFNSPQEANSASPLKAIRTPQTQRATILWNEGKLDLTGTDILLHDYPIARVPVIRVAAVFALIKNNSGIPEKLVIQHFTSIGMKPYLIERAIAELKFKKRVVCTNFCLTAEPEIKSVAKTNVKCIPARALARAPAKVPFRSSDHPYVPIEQQDFGARLLALEKEDLDVA